jgi:hypothetical protein
VAAAKLTFVGVVSEVASEDSGQALIAELEEDDNLDEGMFVRFQSWSENKNHREFNMLIQQGHKYKVIIERLD